MQGRPSSISRVGVYSDDCESEVEERDERVRSTPSAKCQDWISCGLLTTTVKHHCPGIYVLQLPVSKDQSLKSIHSGLIFSRSSRLPSQSRASHQPTWTRQTTIYKWPSFSCRNRLLSLQTIAKHRQTAINKLVYLPRVRHYYFLLPQMIATSTKKTNLSLSRMGHALGVCSKAEVFYCLTCEIQR